MAHTCGGGEDFGGAGLWIVGSLSYRLSTLVEHNTIVNNKSVTTDTSARGMKGRGGALIAAGTKVVFRNNIVWGNADALEVTVFSDEEDPSAANVSIDDLFGPGEPPPPSPPEPPPPPPSPEPPAPTTGGVF